MARRYPWGIRKVDLGRLSLANIRYVFYGIHNLAVPFLMLNLENSDEILAQYLAAGKLKIGDRHRSGDIPRNFFRLVRMMNREVYHSGNFRFMASQCKGKRYSAKKGKQQERLRKLKPEVRDAFVNSFFQPYNYDFRDPGGKSKRVYALQAYQLIEGEYHRMLNSGSRNLEDTVEENQQKLF